MIDLTQHNDCSSQQKFHATVKTHSKRLAPLLF